MQVFANVATEPVRKVTKATLKEYFEFRIAESHRGLEREPATFYTCRLMRNSDPQLTTGDFVKVTGRLKTDFYLSREGKPTGTLLIIAFEAAKIAKPAGCGMPAPAATTDSTVRPVATGAAPVSTMPLPQSTVKPATTPCLAFDWED